MRHNTFFGAVNEDRINEFIMPRRRNIDLSDIDPPSERAQASQSIIPRFSGNGSTIKISNWLKAFEVVTITLDDNRRIQKLIQYLDGDAFDWFVEEVIGDIDSLTWQECKEKLIERFGEPITRPIIAAQQRFLKRDESVQSYFNDKMRLLRMVGLKDADMVAMLTEGTPFHYKQQLIVANITTPVKWLSIALQLEEANRSFRARKAWQQPATVAYTNSENQQNNKKKPQKRPPRPCKYCKDQGFTEWHWHNECPRRQTSSQQTTTSEAEPTATFSAHSTQIPPQHISEN